MKICILFALILACFIFYFQFYDLIKKPIDEFLHDKKVDYSNTPTINKAEETLVSVGVEVPKFDENDTQTIYFEDAKCFSLSEIYDIDSSRRRLLKIAIGAEKMTIDDTTFICR